MDKLRVDKWLWAARFFKHRTLATEAVEGGKVQLNGIRVKPAKDVKVGDRVDIQIADSRYTVIVTAIADKRGSASVAQTLYAETADSSAVLQLYFWMPPKTGARLYVDDMELALY